MPRMCVIAIVSRHVLYASPILFTCKSHTVLFKRIPMQSHFGQREEPLHWIPNYPSTIQHHVVESDIIQDGTVQFKSSDETTPLCVSLIGLIDGRRESEHLNTSTVRDYEVRRVIISGASDGQARIILFHGAKEDFAAASVPSDFSLMTTSTIVKSQEDVIYDSGVPGFQTAGSSCNCASGKTSWFIDIDGSKLKAKVSTQGDQAVVSGDLLVIILFAKSSFEEGEKRPFTEFNYQLSYVTGWSPVRHAQGKQIVMQTASGPKDGREKGRVVPPSKSMRSIAAPPQLAHRFTPFPLAAKKKKSKKGKKVEQKKKDQQKSLLQKLKQLQAKKKPAAVKPPSSSVLRKFLLAKSKSKPQSKAKKQKKHPMKKSLFKAQWPLK